MQQKRQRQDLTGNRRTDRKERLFGRRPGDWWITALKYEATDIDSLINLHNRIYSQVPELAPMALAGDIPELTRVIPI